MGKSEFGTMLRAAESDLKALRNMPDRFAFDERIFGFHAQQACEKALKAWLLHLGHAPPFIHDLRELIALLASQGVTVTEAADIAPFTIYAAQTRYGDEPTNLIDRLATVALCERLFNDVAEVTGYQPQKR